MSVTVVMVFLFFKKNQKQNRSALPENGFFFFLYQEMKID